MNPAELRSLTEEARRFLEAECPIAATRALDGGHSDKVWKQMAELGWLGVAVDDAHGGLGLGTTALCALAREAGRVVAPGPFLFTAALAAPLLAEAGDNLLPYVLSGESILPVAVTDALMDGGVIDGAASAVVDAVRSEHIAVIAGEHVAIVDTKNTSVEPLDWIDLARRTARVTFERTPIVAMLDVDATRILDRARIAVAAEALGAAERALEVATEYAKQRVQFGKPIGSFQAVQHLLAQMLERVELTRAAVDGAARAIDAGDPAAHQAALTAKAMSGDCSVRVAADAIQVHGGIGFTWEHDAHLYYRRAVGNAALLGTPAWCRERLAAAIL